MALVTTAEIAAAYNEAAAQRGEPGIDVKTVRNQIKAHRLRATQIGGQWLVDEADAEAWLRTYERYARRA